MARLTRRQRMGCVLGALMSLGAATAFIYRFGILPCWLRAFEVFCVVFYLGVAFGCGVSAWRGRSIFDEPKAKPS